MHFCPPFVHVSLPTAQTPCKSSIVHSSPTHEISSSVSPSQSLSSPSQVSTLSGKTIWVHFSLPSVHLRSPTAQTPCKSSIVQGSPTHEISSSVSPSQSLSSPSQLSLDDSTCCLQISSPPIQVLTPAAQTPNFPVLQPSPPPGLSSSVSPSQSLSSPSHSSSSGSPGVHVFSTPSVHFRTSLKHSPLPQLIFFIRSNWVVDALACSGIAAIFSA